MAINVSDLIANVRQNPILWYSRVDGYKKAEWNPTIWAQIAVNLKADKCVCSSLWFMWLGVLYCKQYRISYFMTNEKNIYTAVDVSIKLKL